MESKIHLVDPLCSFLSSSYWLFRYTAFRMLNPEELHSSGSIHLGNELWIEMVCDWSILSSSLINGNTASLLGYMGQRSNFKISVVLHVSFSTNIWPTQDWPNHNKGIKFICSVKLDYTTLSHHVHSYTKQCIAIRDAHHQGYGNECNPPAYIILREDNNASYCTKKGSWPLNKMKKSQKNNMIICAKSVNLFKR